MNNNPSKEDIINQAIRFHLQGNIPEATKYYEYCIAQDLNDSKIFSNYGTILRDLGKLEDAEISSRKAIKLNPDIAFAHSNLGNVLRDLGKLKDAELLFRKAIKLNSDLAGAYSNLGGILRDLGKLQELIYLSKSILESISMNQGYKLRASLLLTIAYLLQGDYAKTLFYLKQTNQFMGQDALNIIPDETTRKYTSNFFKYINALYPLLTQENKKPNSKKIAHFGESHCLSFAHQNLSISSQIKKIQPVLITGGKAWHFANNKNNKWKDSLTQQIKNHTYCDEVFISFGEIDCRKEEGILPYASKKNKNISEVCEETIKGYLNYMEKVLSPHYSKKYYFGVPAPSREKGSLDELDIKRIETIKIYNSLLKKEVLTRGSFFLDVFALTSNQN